MDKLKKYWPFLLLLVIVLFVVGLIGMVRGRGGEAPIEEEENIAIVPEGQRPVTMLVPRDDGHWVDLTVENINVQGASAIEYEFTYTTADGRSQGTGGTEPFSSGDNMEKEILIGTTSSGNYYYDEGVETGELDLKFRDDSGKSIGRLTTPWNFRHEPESIEFEGFTFSPEESEDLYFVAMNTFGLPGNLPGAVSAGPVGFFASDEVEGTITAASGQVYRWTDNEWQMVEDGSSVEPGIFISVTQ